MTRPAEPAIGQVQRHYIRARQQLLADLPRCNIDHLLANHRRPVRYEPLQLVGTFETIDANRPPLTARRRVQADHRAITGWGVGKGMSGERDQQGLPDRDEVEIRGLPLHLAAGGEARSIHIRRPQRPTGKPVHPANRTALVDVDRGSRHRRRRGQEGSGTPHLLDGAARTLIGESRIAKPTVQRRLFQRHRPDGLRDQLGQFSKPRSIQQPGAATRGWRGALGHKAIQLSRQRRRHVAEVLKPRAGEAQPAGVTGIVSGQPDHEPAVSGSRAGQVPVPGRLRQPTQAGVETGGLQILLPEAKKRLQPRLGAGPRHRHSNQTIRLQQPPRLGRLDRPVALKQPFVALQLREHPCPDRDEMVGRALVYRQELQRVVVEQLLIKPNRLARVVLGLLPGETKQLPRPRRVVDVNRVFLTRRRRHHDQRQGQAAGCHDPALSYPVSHSLSLPAASDSFVW